MKRIEKLSNHRLVRILLPNQNQLLQEKSTYNLNLEMNKIIITGIGGFIGYHLAKFLLTNTNFEIVGVDSLNDYYDVNLKYARLKDLGIISEKYYFDKEYSSKIYKLSFWRCDITNNLSKILDSNVYCIYHLAAQAGVRYSLINPAAYISSNINGFFNVIDSIRLYSPQAILVYASSSSVYGDSLETPFVENLNVDKPVSLYAATKISNEIIAYSYQQTFGIKSIGLRFFTVYGPYGRPDMAYFSFTKDIINGNPIKIFNNGEMRRDFTYISDVIAGLNSIRLCLDLYNFNKDIKHVYNIGGSNPIILNEFLNILENKIGKKAIVVFEGKQKGDVTSTYASMEKFNNAFNYCQTVSVNDGLEHFVSWYKSFYV
ncbi:NAD-dependent epimerase/dehydratase family protein [Sediminibacterium sp. C3]|uniref:NAD-dependent epimerase/dehydratase family protein n=1 Tax=Sediminibacterium sp. C3 TaxID=1267211 RepID=UPI00040C1A10|nr:NAD-dependent epimerase/dehydratase family protein [Sediminibacterium sp. C3]